MSDYIPQEDETYTGAASNGSVSPTATMSVAEQLRTYPSLTYIPKPNIIPILLSVDFCWVRRAIA